MLTWPVFLPSARGNVTVLTALSLLVVFIACGTAIDFGRLLTARTQLAAAIDAAALQAGSSNVTDMKKLTALATAVVARNYSEREHGPITALKLSENNGQIDIWAKAKFRTSLLGLAGIRTIDIPISAQVIRSGSSIEVALILDTTGSMSGSKLKSLKSAAASFIDAVVWDNQTRFYAKVALVPYSAGVNLGAYADVARGALKAGLCTEPGCLFYRFRNSNKFNVSFTASTCASERTGADAYTDAPPATALVGINYASPNNPCLDGALIPLTTDKAKLKAAIDRLVAVGSTAGQIGIAWGWYALSRDFGLWNGSSLPAAYGTEKVSKIAVIMTDGEFNTAYCNGVIARSSGNGSGSSNDKINCDATNGSAAEQAMQLCAAMKKKGIAIYTIGFDIADDPAAKTVMTDCASSKKHAYLAATDAELKAAFREIGKRVSALRLSR
ncbi:pilus assembly protein TadG-related protein [Aestuariivirga sp.]|uniref:pilus assembly protein TadG-related protein n=1 Tax=Aestuariivirga sp. TaxID=2650926 RepID=UPI0035945BE1